MKKLIILFLFVPFLYNSLDAQVNRRNSEENMSHRGKYLRFSTGASHTLEIRGGTLWAWGDNVTGQLGDGTTVDKNSPVQIGVDNTWVSVDGGWSHSLGLKANGTLWAWGANVLGQLGNGTTVDQSSPIQIGADSKWVSIAAGDFHTIGLKSDGTLWAWGFNNNGQLGDGTTLDKSSPVQIGVDNIWVGTVCGGDYSFGLKSNGTLWAWGKNFVGQLGDGTTVDKNSPVLIGADSVWVDITAGIDHTLGRKSDGTLWAWGANFNGQLGDGSTMNTSFPIQIGTDQTWIEIEAGQSHTLGLKSNGTLWAWGLNSEGQLGDGTTVNDSVPKQIGSNNRWVDISGGSTYSFGLKANGSLWGWGDNLSGQLGDSTNVDKTSPIPTSIVLDVWLSIIGGDKSSLGLRSDGTVWAWGNNYNGQLGDATTVNKSSPVQIGVDNKWVSIIAGFAHTLGLKSDGTLWAWGNNTYGQLGNGSTTQTLVPVQVGSDNKWVSMSAGQYHTLGLKSDGTLWAWGRSNYGQVGDGTTVTRTNPIQIGVDNKWVRITTGRLYSLGLKSDGTLWAWGGNDFGQLGDATQVQKNSPLQIGSDNKWVSLTAGSGSTLGTKSDGTLWAWGRNSFGELGDGTTTTKLTPVHIGTDSIWVSITTGEYHSLGLRSDGTLWTWGRNNFGQLGDGTNIAKSSPVLIGTNDNWVSIAAGSNHNFGLKSNRAAFCATGFNGGYGTLGNGDFITNSNVFICITNCSVTNTSVSTSICSGDSILLSGIYQTTAGSYIDSLTSSLGCDSVVTTTLTVNPAGPQLDTTGFNITPSTCGASNGSIMGISVTGGSGTLTFEWMNSVPSTVGTFIYLASVPAESYTLTVTDTNGCTDISGAHIISDIGTPPVVNTAFFTVDSSRCDIPTGAISGLTVSGGTAPLTYVWNSIPSQSTLNATGLDAGSYSFQVTDASGCITVVSSPGNFPDVPYFSTPIAPIAASPSAYCSGDPIGDLTAAGGSGTINWYSDALLMDSIGTGSPFASGVSTDTSYWVAESANGCVGPGTQVDLLINPSYNISGTVINICQGDSVMLGGVYQTVSGSYSDTLISSSGCDSILTITLIVNSAPTADTGPANQFCTGDSVSIGGVPAALGGTPPYNYLWSPGAGLSDSTVANPNASPIVPTQYSLVVTDSNGCTGTGNQGSNMILLPNPTGVVTSSADTGACSGTAIGTASGGVPPYTYIWDDPSAQTSSTATGLCAGLYTLWVLDSNSCLHVDTISVDSPTTGLCNVSVTVNSINANCGISNGSASVAASGGTPPYTYQWSSGDTLSTTDSLNAGVYMVDVWDANGCNAIGVANISNASGPTLSTTNIVGVSCYGGSDGELGVAIMDGTPPYTYVWSSGDSIPVLSGLQAGPYDFQVIDAIGCITTVNLVVPTPALISISGQMINATCGSSDGSMGAVVTGGTAPYTYLWSNASSSSSILGVGSGAYSVTITDANACLDSASGAISESGAATVVIDSVLSAPCSGSGSIYISTSGGTAPFSYLWSNGVSTEDNPGIAAGIYAITVTDSTGCMAVSSIEVTVDVLDIVQICLVTVDSIDPFNVVVWEKPPSSSIEHFNIYKESTTAGVYFLAGAVDYDSLSVFPDPNSNPNQRSWRYKMTAVDFCGNESGYSDAHKTMHLSISQGLGNDYNLAWNHYEGFSYGTYYIHRYRPSEGWIVKDSLPANLSSWTDFFVPQGKVEYIVEAKHPSGCLATKVKNYNSAKSNTRSLDVLGTLASSTSSVNAGMGNCDGTATSTPSGGTPPYTYLWNDSLAQTSSTAVDLCPGFYSVSILDADGSAVDDTITVGEDTGAPPVIDYFANFVVITEGDSVNFADLSTNSPTTWSWVFTGGIPGSSFDQHPTDIRYDNAGSYDVSLLATNSFGSDTLVKTAYILVNPAVGITEFSVGPRNVKLSPNPFSEFTTLEFDNPDNALLRLVIYDATGKLIREYNDVSGYTVIIKRGNLSPGTYYFQLEGERGRDAGAFIVE